MLVHITDQLTDWRYLLDTGASFSLVPHRSNDLPATEPRLTGPNSSLLVFLYNCGLHTDIIVDNIL